MDIILYAVPGFLVLILVELLAEKVRGTDYYRVNDSITSLATGVLSQLMKIVHLMIPVAVYVVVFENYAIFSLGQSALIYLIAFVLYDFCYYWNHRLGHEMNLLWAAHVIHHSSEEYNLTTALRQTSSSVLSFVFYLPLALLGFDPVVVVTVGAFNLIYQYWVHTRHIGKLGWFENFFITPSNHRVHHAQNGVYIDRNYGGVFILWDRLFNSFQEELEDQPVIFGIRGAVASWNPLWVNFQVYSQLAKDCWHTKNLWHKLTIWFRKTGWRPPDVVDAYPLHKTDLNDFQKYHTVLTKAQKIYSITQHILHSGIALGLLLNLSSVAVEWQVVTILFVIFASFSTGAFMEAKSYATMLEVSKHAALLLLMLVFAPSPTLWFLILPIAISSLIYLALAPHATKPV